MTSNWKKKGSLSSNTDSGSTKLLPDKSSHSPSASFLKNKALLRRVFLPSHKNNLSPQIPVWLDDKDSSFLENIKTEPCGGQAGDSLSSVVASINRKENPKMKLDVPKSFQDRKESFEREDPKVVTSVLKNATKRASVSVQCNDVANDAADDVIVDVTTDGAIASDVDPFVENERKYSAISSNDGQFSASGKISPEFSIDLNPFHYLENKVKVNGTLENSEHSKPQLKPGNYDRLKHLQIVASQNSLQLLSSRNSLQFQSNQNSMQLLTNQNSLQFQSNQNSLLLLTNQRHVCGDTPNYDIYSNSSCCSIFSTNPRTDLESDFVLENDEDHFEYNLSKTKPLDKNCVKQRPKFPTVFTSTKDF